ncbi:hypothetical protein EN792_044685 [Mesorhizobium sp. M00.F.Ca.ET.149.01.1.1]|nr:hypothetical protein EN792_044685 [Mesorhizobium sp. M00.F.Ca.ET.149.01.1.1]
MTVSSNALVKARCVPVVSATVRPVPVLKPPLEPELRETLEVSHDGRAPVKRVAPPTEAVLVI